MKGNGSKGNGTSPRQETSSGLELEQDGECKPITEVINTYELIGDDVRAKLVASIKAAILEAREAQRQAKRYVQRRAALQQS